MQPAKSSASSAPLSERLLYRLKRLQQALRAATDAALSQVGITGPQYAVLTALEEAPGSSSAALARRCFVTAQTMDEIVGGLATAKLIRRAAPTRGRAVKLSLTARGTERLVAAHAVMLAVEEKALSALPPSERRQFLAALEHCSATLEG